MWAGKKAQLVEALTSKPDGPEFNLEDLMLPSDLHIQVVTSTGTHTKI